MEELPKIWMVNLFHKLSPMVLEKVVQLRQDLSPSLICTQIILEKKEKVLMDGNLIIILNMLVIYCIIQPRDRLSATSLQEQSS